MQGGYYRQDPQPMDIQINHMEMDPASPPPPPPEQIAAAAEPAPTPSEGGTFLQHRCSIAANSAELLDHIHKICDGSVFEYCMQDVLRVSS